MKILFVENHSIFANQVCREFLSEHQVTVVSSLHLARQEFAANRFDLLLVDYDLDDGKGDELVREIFASNSDVKIVAVSSHDEGNAALMKAGAGAVCSKMHFNKMGDVLSSLAP
jgi:DNA-binding response OmpR family regulator